MTTNLMVLLVFLAFCIGASIGVLLGTGISNWSSEADLRESPPLQPAKGQDFDKLSPEQQRQLLG
jgi:hypothetical protein